MSKLNNPLESLPLQVRNLHDSDKSFIYSTWLKSYRSSNFAKEMDNPIYFLHHKQYIERVLEDENSVFLIVCDVEDPEQIYSYICYRQLNPNSSIILDYIYTKYTYRKLGIASRLLDQVIQLSKDQRRDIFCTHAGRQFTKYKDKYNLIYNPYLLGV